MNEIITKDTNGALQKIYTPPAGEIMLFAGNNVPDGWLPCNGAVVNRSAYPELFEAIGTIYGTGNGSTTFALPDTADRFPRFAGTLDVGVTQEDAIRNIYGHCGALYRSATLGSEGAMRITQYGTTPAAQGTAGAIIGDNVSITIDASSFVPTAAENRPKAIALKACIKY